MNNQHIIKRKWFWAWQDEKEEAWLAEMAKQGLLLEQVSLPGRYEFRSAEAGNYVYRLDYRHPARMEKDAYLQLFQDAGWEHLGSLSGWQYFRKIARAEEPLDIYTDVESKVEKYRRLLGVLVVVLLIWMPIWFVLLGRFQKKPPDGLASALLVITILFFFPVHHFYSQNLAQD